ncbi:MAG: peptidyl-prolyl cis-trans isomerase [Sphingomonadales bacterium]|nr:peptidyl-prolyl cis-trans isomerase [Sphingomonadales bacterium]
MYQDFSREAAPAFAPGRAGRRDWRSRLRPLLREPLTHFLVLGALIFAVSHWLEARSQRYVIHVAPADLTRIENGYVQQYGSAPTPAQLRTMVDNTVREEIYLREALALGLDRNDEIVRRRLAQKYQFLQADMATPRPPSEAELRRWFDAHAAQFAEAPRRSFDQRYFAIDQRGEAAARALATARLAAGAGAPGDEFPGPKVVARLAQDDVERLFGSAELARAVFAARPGQWLGPVRSGFGWHLIRVTDATPGRARGFEEARGDALAAWQDEDRRARNDAAYRALLARYTVRVEQRP